MFLFSLLRQPSRHVLSFRNAGLGDNLLAAAHAWLYAQRTGRSLIICWTLSRYMDDARENAFWHLFDLPSAIETVPIVTVSRVDLLSTFLIAYWHFLSPFPDLWGIVERLAFRRWGYDFFDRQANGLLNSKGSAVHKRQAKEQHMVATLVDAPGRLFITTGCYSPDHRVKPFFDALRLRPWLEEEVSRFVQNHFQNKTVIGVHIRYYSPLLPPSSHSPYWSDTERALQACLAKIAEAVQRSGSEKPVIFVSTDSSIVSDFIKMHVPGVVSVSKSFGSNPRMELHDELPVASLADSLVEMFLLARSDVLVRYPPASWFSYYASLYAREIVS